MVFVCSGKPMYAATSVKSQWNQWALTVQFSSRWYLCAQESPYMLPLEAKGQWNQWGLIVQFSSRWYLCAQESPHVLPQNASGQSNQWGLTVQFKIVSPPRGKDMGSTVSFRFPSVASETIVTFLYTNEPQHNTHWYSSVCFLMLFRATCKFVPDALCQRATALFPL